MVKKTYQHLAPDLGTWGAYFMHQLTISGLKDVSMYQNDRWNIAVNSRYLQSGQNNTSSGQKRPQKSYHLAQCLGPVGVYLLPGVKRCSKIPNDCWNVEVNSQSTISLFKQRTKILNKSRISWPVISGCVISSKDWCDAFPISHANMQFGRKQNINYFSHWPRLHFHFFISQNNNSFM